MNENNEMNEEFTTTETTEEVTDETTEETTDNGFESRDYLIFACCAAAIGGVGYGLWKGLKWTAHKIDDAITEAAIKRVNKKTLKKVLEEDAKTDPLDVEVPEFITE